MDIVLKNLVSDKNENLKRSRKSEMQNRGRFGLFQHLIFPKISKKMKGDCYRLAATGELRMRSEGTDCVKTVLYGVTVNYGRLFPFDTLAFFDRFLILS